MANNLQTATQVIGLLSDALTLAANLGVDIQSVSQQLAAAQAQGKTLSTTELEQMAKDWTATDAKFESDYAAKMGQSSGQGS